MHELSVCQALIRQVEDVAREHGAKQVKAIHLDIGPLSGVEPELLRRAYDIAAGGTAAEGARLHIAALPLRVRCEECGAESTVAPNRLLCGRCGTWHTRLISGDEMLLRSLELDLPTS